MENNESESSEKPLSPSPIPCPEIGEDNAFLPFEDYDAFPTEPIGMADALTLMNENLSYTIGKVHIFSRFSKEYFKASDELLNTFNQFARGLVTLIRTDPGLYAERYDPTSLFRMMIGEVSSQLLKTRDGFLESENNCEIRDILANLQTKNFTFLQRLYATEKWAIASVEKYADGFLKEKTEELKEKREAEKKAASGEPAPIRSARPIIPLREKLTMIKIAKFVEAAKAKKAPESGIAAEPDHAAEQPTVEAEMSPETKPDSTAEASASDSSSFEESLEMAGVFPVGLFGQPSASTAKNILQIKDQTNWKRSFEQMKECREGYRRSVYTRRGNEPPGWTDLAERDSGQDSFQGNESVEDNFDDEDEWENLDS